MRFQLRMAAELSSKFWINPVMTYFTIGKLSKPYGLRGQIKTQFFVDALDDLKAFTAFYIKDAKAPGGFKKLVFTSIKDKQEGTIVEIEGCVDRTQAEILSGSELFVDEAEFPRLKGETYYIKDLLEVEAMLGDEPFGKIINIIETGNKTMLIIKLVDQKEIAVPFMERYVGKVEIAQKKVALTEQVRELL